uniref:hypothetical protein n=1 Tax=Lentilactobacillus hilgardii TaxID=1588 RepID=UPI00403F38A9
MNLIGEYQNTLQKNKELTDRINQIGLIYTTEQKQADKIKPFLTFLFSDYDDESRFLLNRYLNRRSFCYLHP